MKTLTYPIRGNKFSVNVEIKEHLAHEVSPFQTIDLYDTEALGKVMFLDNHVQLAELDEQAYHESLVHIPLLSLENPKRALVVGGGDGGTLRELCRNKSLNEIDIVEIDEAVIRVSKEVWPSLSNGAFEDPRVTLHVADAFGFVRNVTNPYDLIIMDVTDCYEGEDGELSEKLFTAEFHQDCANALSDRGMLVTQADNHIFCPYSLEDVLNTFSEHFPTVGHFQALVPSFGGYSAYAFGSKGATLAPNMPPTNQEFAYLNAATWALAHTKLGFRIG